VQIKRYQNLLYRGYVTCASANEDGDAIINRKKTELLVRKTSKEHGVTPGDQARWCQHQAHPSKPRIKHLLDRSQRSPQAEGSGTEPPQKRASTPHI
jgi:hypothetical protein